MDENQRYKIRVEYGVAAVVMLVGLFFVFQAMTIDTSREAVGPRTMPLYLAIGLMIGGAWLFLRAMTGKAGDLREGYGFLDSDIGRIILVVACGCVFLAVFWALGFFSALLATFFFMLLVFGVRNIISIVLGPVLLACLFQWLFIGVMIKPDPKGALYDMRPHTNWISGLE